MSLWAIVPVKPLPRGKSRLSSVLSNDERIVLNRCLLIHTLETLKKSPGIERVLVISRDPQALSLAREHGAHTVQEHGAPQLNVALTRATLIAKTQARRGVLILPADLALLTPDEVAALLGHNQGPPVVVIAPDRRGQGTNALLVNPPGLIQYTYGPGSFARHCERARQVGARLEIVNLPALALDVDLPEDLEMVRQEVDDMIDWREER